MFAKSVFETVVVWGVTHGQLALTRPRSKGVHTPAVHISVWLHVARSAALCVKEGQSQGPETSL